MRVPWNHSVTATAALRWVTSAKDRPVKSGIFVVATCDGRRSLTHRRELLVLMANKDVGEPSTLEGWQSKQIFDEE